ncbi:hypothetical protein [Streptomyces noursei]
MSQTPSENEFLATLNATLAEGDWCVPVSKLPRIAAAAQQFSCDIRAAASYVALLDVIDHRMRQDGVTDRAVFERELNGAILTSFESGDVWVRQIIRGMFEREFGRLNEAAMRAVAEAWGTGGDPIRALRAFRGDFDREFEEPNAFGVVEQVRDSAGRLLITPAGGSF